MHALVVVFLIGCLCGCTRRESTPAGDRSPEALAENATAAEAFLTVSRSAAELEAARKLAAPTAAPDPLSAGTLTNTWSWDLSPTLLDQKQGEPLIRSLLRDGNPDQKRSILHALSFGSAEALPITDPGLVAELKALMSDPDHGETAIRLYASRRLPDTAATLWEALPRSDGRPAGEILFWLVRLQPDRRTLEACAQALAGTNAQTRYRCLWGMEKFFDCPDAALAQDASECAAAELIRQLADSPQKRLDYPQSTYAAVLQRGTGPQARKLAKLVFETLKMADPCLHAYAYAAIQKSEGAPGRRQLIRDLADSRQFKLAIQAVAALYGRTGDAEMSDALATRASREQDPARLVSLAETLLVVGGAQAADRARAVAARLPEEARLRVLRAAGKQEPRALARRLTAAGILDSTRVEGAVSNALAWHLEYYGREAAAVFDAQEFLSAAGIVLTFDVETDALPVRHDKLIDDLAKVSSGEFQPQFCHETCVGNPGEDQDGAAYRVQFIQGERLYRFIARDYGDWYDVERVVLACNRALADAGSARRFMALTGDGQCASIICATAAQAKVLAEQFHLSFDSNLGTAMQDGKAYEAEAIEHLNL